VFPLQARCGPEGGQRYSSILPWPRNYKVVTGQQHAPAALYPRERPGTHFTGGWVGTKAGLDGRKNFFSTEIRSQTLQPVVSRHTDWTTGPTYRDIRQGILTGLDVALYLSGRHIRRFVTNLSCGSDILDNMCCFMLCRNCNPACLCNKCQYVIRRWPTRGDLKSYE